MKLYPYSAVRLHDSYLGRKEALNRKITIPSVYDRFSETGRIAAFRCDYKAGEPNKPHFFWDSDVAKWMEGAAYEIAKSPDDRLIAKIDEIVECIKKNQGEDGYFNIYYTVIEPEGRWSNRDHHELYCAGHLMEAAVAYAEATGKCDFLHCMEKYADYIYRVFVTEGSASFKSPGHEEIELALVRMYRYTKKKKYLELASHFINERGVHTEAFANEQYQSHLPVREQKEALGHAVRALYLYTGMAYVAKETGDESLVDACKTLWEDVTERKMYLTGGVGSTNIGEAFTHPYDLPNDTAYAETCASIALVFFAGAMLALENDAKYADIIERAIYNGVLSGLSLDGTKFFYTNPLQINLGEHFQNMYDRRRLPITQRPAIFECSCCPPNVNRLLSSLGNTVYGCEGDTLYVNQFVASSLSSGDVIARVKTAYPCDGEVNISATGVKTVAIRIPTWCESFSISKSYEMKNGYALVAADGEITVRFDLRPTAVYADTRVIRDSGKLAIMRGPIVYCAESVDNEENLHAYAIPNDFTYEEKYDESIGLYTLKVDCFLRKNGAEGLYSRRAPKYEKATLNLIPYNAFANRGECNMTVWLHTK